MRRFWLGTLALTAASVLAMALTLLVPTLGFPLWHYNVAFAVIVGAAAAGWALMRRRRVATLTMAFTGALATVTGFVMLYTKEFAFKEWVTWWHSVTSVAFVIAFLAHWLHNNPRLVDLTKRLLFGSRATGLAAAGAWAGVLAFGVWTGMPHVRARFTTDNYGLLASWALFVGVAATYGTWLAYRLPTLRARLGVTAHRNRSRALVDGSLFLANWGALLTGFALLYFADFLRGGTFKYVSKWWHTATSVALLALLAIHIGFNARILRAHARRVDEDLAPRE